ncbi:hypothetical protein HC725_03775 [Vibrio sp. S17_S38]|uniref:hypothetical protein n=1 Tax=Vibrio sp. S17_S38 TaxID=2720229 RepID=UPI0016815CF2|nr:hypothetical protein [Vibrio sp. S17_S38]MBD1572405.1 hypothetical protein [Vibrio sp. S17_S38]
MASIIAIGVFLLLNLGLAVSLSPLVLSPLLIQLSFKLCFQSIEDNKSSYSYSSIFHPVTAIQTELMTFWVQLRLNNQVIRLWRYQFNEDEYRRLLVLLNQDDNYRLEVKKEP